MTAKLFKKILPQHSKLRQKLAYQTATLNLGVGRHLKQNFRSIDDKNSRKLVQQLQEHYLPLNYDPETLKDHLFRRTHLDRYTIIPWLNKHLPLQGTEILEVGCGTGSSTVALAEQGAKITAMDLHGRSLKVAKERCSLYGIDGVNFVKSNARDISSTFSSRKFSIVIFFATLEHMTLSERRAALAGAANLIRKDGIICITETPNRLWFYDSHTSWLPFYNWLPDELAKEYSKFSPRKRFKDRLNDSSTETLLPLYREGRGMSFHELDLEYGGPSGYKVVSDLSGYLNRRNMVKFFKRLLAGDGRKERLLHEYDTLRHRGLFREYLDLIIKLT